MMKFRCSMMTKMRRISIYPYSVVRNRTTRNNGWKKASSKVARRGRGLGQERSAAAAALVVVAADLIQRQVRLMVTFVVIEPSQGPTEKSTFVFDSIKILCHLVDTTYIYSIFSIIHVYKYALFCETN